MQLNPEKICLIGFGEVGGIFATDLVAKSRQVATYDILVETEGSRQVLAAKVAAAGAQLFSTLAEAVSDASLVISAVTATAAQQVARDCGGLLRTGQMFVDINSISPNAKRENSQAVEASGAVYVEAAVMAPVSPQRLQVPMLLGGRHANEADRVLQSIGMNTTVASNEIGVASAIKMCRSIMIKGLEALTVECMLAARRYGAEDAVLASLHKSFPSLGWDRDFPDYLIGRVAEHGRRRAAEMREVAATLQDVGLSPTMAAATARRHDALLDAMQTAACTFNPNEKFSWRELADKLQGTN
jgi:3-hydroxyisobutyrate dehydrogenase-like beta-hydroxyacid dehydrogenase